MRGGGERSQSGISLFVTCGRLPCWYRFASWRGRAWANCQFRPDRRSANRFQPSDFFRARLAAKALASGSSAAPGCRNRARDLDVARLERSNLVLHLGNVHLASGVRCGQVGLSKPAEQLCSRAVLVSVLQTPGRRSRQARSRARAKRTAAAGSKADEAMPEAGENAAARASMELSAARGPIGSCRPGLHRARQAPEHGPQTGFGAAD